MSRLVVYLLIIPLIIFRYFSTKPSFSEGQRLRISAKVLQEPAIYSFSQKVVLEGLKVYLPKYPEIHYGDRVVVEGVVSEKQLKDVKLIKVEESKNYLYNFRNKLISFFQKSLPEPHSSLVAGIILGSKANFPYQFWSALRKTGTMHVVVASGMNVTFVAGFLLSLFILFVPRKTAIPLALLGIWMYTAVSGLEAPIVRAALMASVALSAQEFGRVTYSWNSLFLSALLMLVYRPLWVCDLGFILSFVATTSLMLFQARIEKIIKFVPKILRQDLSTTLAAQIGVTPILFVTFGQFNLFSPFINALVLWTVPLIMILGSIGGLVGLVIPLVGKLILYLLYPLTWFFVSVVQTFG